MGIRHKTLYLIRHGETGSNVDGRFQDASEPLTERGHAQAHALAVKLARLRDRYPISILLTSTDLRAVQTADPIGKALGLTPLLSPLFVERRHPSVIRGKLTTNPDALAIHSNGRQNFHDPSFVYGDGETFAMMKHRGLVGIEDILNLPDEHTDVGLVTHGVHGTVLAALSQRGEHLTSHDLNAYQFRLDNTGLCILGYETRTNFSEKGQGWVIHKWNDTTHLE